MDYNSPHKQFIFEDILRNEEKGELRFHYSFDGERHFYERIQMDVSPEGENVVLDRAIEMAFLLAGISYYKAFPTRELAVKTVRLSAEEAVFYDKVYLHGLSQFVYENGLSPDDIGHFIPNSDMSFTPKEFTGSGTTVLQSGGKDSLLLATLLQKSGHDFSPLYMTANGSHPAVLDELGGYPLTKIRRTIDREGLAWAAEHGGLNGHVPVTFITLAYALVHSLANKRNTVLAAIGREGEEPHAMIGEYAITHQWSKTWTAEQMLISYVRKFLSPDLRIGSPLRGYSELKIAELFVKHCWEKYGMKFSSCNVANYQQAHENSQLTWCGSCPKCANSYLLFAAFVEPEDLTQIFGSNLYENPELVETFKGLLDIDDVFKPFECVGETEELRLAYYLSQQRGHKSLKFTVPESKFQKDAITAAQQWAQNMLP